VRWTDVLLIGLGQAVAILPGISRSGATIAAASGVGLRRDAAARFSFLLSVPIVMGAGLFASADMLSSQEPVQATVLLAGGLLPSFAVGLGAVRLLMRQLRNGRLYPYAVYCAIAGIGCLIVATLRGA
jgi:undecaprenyl-diphosphatase